MYNANEMPLSNREELKDIQIKVLNNIPITIGERLKLGRDKVVREINGYQLKPNCVYRAISQRTLEKYQEYGYIVGNDREDEYVEYIKDVKIYNNNRGVDWYLGGAAPGYGEIILECPAYKEYFIPAYDNGSGMALDPLVRHMKSSGAKNPVPLSMITNIFYIQKEKNLKR